MRVSRARSSGCPKCRAQVPPAGLAGDAILAGMPSMPDPLAAVRPSGAFSQTYAEARANFRAVAAAAGAALTEITHPLRGPQDIDGPQPALADAALQQYRLQHGDQAFHEAMVGGQYAFWEPCPRPRWVLRCGPTTGCTRAGNSTAPRGGPSRKEAPARGVLCRHRQLEAAGARPRRRTDRQGTAATRGLMRRTGLAHPPPPTCEHRP